MHSASLIYHSSNSLHPSIHPPIRHQTNTVLSSFFHSSTYLRLYPSFHHPPYFPSIHPTHHHPFSHPNICPLFIQPSLRSTPHLSMHPFVPSSSSILLCIHSSIHPTLDHPSSHLHPSDSSSIHFLFYFIRI